MENRKTACNQICRWNDSSDGCVIPQGAICPMSNTEPDYSGAGQVNEKLIELIRDGEGKIVIADLMSPEQQKEAIYSQLSDHLVANDVTIQRWIPVTERLPEPDRWVLACGKYTRSVDMIKLSYDGSAITADGDIGGFDVYTHWMDLPEPPEDQHKHFPTGDCK